MESCFGYALKHCSRFPKTTYLLRVHLQKKEYSLEEINETIVRLERQGIIDDQLYTQMYIQSEVCRKGKAYLLIKAKLINKGVDKAMIENQYDILYDECIEGMSNTIKTFIEKSIDRGYDKQKILQKLAAKGYDFGLINKIVGLFDI